MARCRCGCSSATAPRLQQALPGPLVLLFFYALVAMVSSAYVPAYAFYSMWKGFEVLVDVLVMAAILSYADAARSARTAYRLLPILNGILVVVYLVGSSDDAVAGVVAHSRIHPDLHERCPAGHVAKRARLLERGHCVRRHLPVVSAGPPGRQAALRVDPMPVVDDVDLRAVAHLGDRIGGGA